MPHHRDATFDSHAGADESGHVDREDAIKPSTKPMSPRTARRLHYLRSLQDATSDDLRALRVKYSAALEAEEFRESCGISYSRRQPDLALGLVTLTVLLYIKTRFRHSKLQPLKQEIYDVQAHQRKIQRDATNLKHGKPTEYDWDWPEETVVRRRSARRSVGRRGAAELEVGEAGGGVV